MKTKVSFIATLLFLCVVVVKGQDAPDKPVRIDFDKLVALYIDEAGLTLWKFYNVENEKDASIASSKKGFFEKDKLVLQELATNASNKYVSKELNYEHSIDFLKKELRIKFPVLDDCFFTRVYDKIFLEFSKLNAVKP